MHTASCKPDRPLRSLLSVALSSLSVKLLHVIIHRAVFDPYFKIVLDMGYTSHPTPLKKQYIGLAFAFRGLAATGNSNPAIGGQKVLIGNSFVLLIHFLSIW